MYVCSCKAINCSKIRTAVERGAKTGLDVFRMHGVKPKCGTCVKHMHNAVDEERAKAIKAA